MPRRSFWIGMLTGLVMGAVLMFANVSLYQANQPPPRPAAGVPMWVPVNGQTQVPAVPEGKQIPENWQQFDFNGHPVYVIPLAQRGN